MMRRLFDALLLKGLWKFKPIHVIAFWLFMAYQGWMASPYFMYYVVGAPEPGTAPRYVGALQIEGQLRRGNTGWIPPRYFIRTSDGQSIEFHCGYLPIKQECYVLFAYSRGYTAEDRMEIGFDPFWGVDYAKYPARHSRFDERGAKDAIARSRLSKLSEHRWPLFRLIGGVCAYILLLTLSIVRPKIWSRPRTTDDSRAAAVSAELLRLRSRSLTTDNPPAEAQIAERLNQEAKAQSKKT
jgi:hypothetical protein